METLSFDDIKLGFKKLQENNEELQKRFAETDERLDKRLAETDRRLAETDKPFAETNEQFKETDKKIKEAFNLFTTQWGRLMETLVEGDLVSLLQAKGIPVTDTSTRRKGRRGGENFEFDIIAYNGTAIVIVEVKTMLKPDDVKDFVAKLIKAKIYMPEYADRHIIGAIAFLQADAGSEKFAEAQGLFVIKATGNSASIINTPNFTPKLF